jgi:hypothetical protein
MNKKTLQDQGFNTQTYDNPSEAFLASVMENSGVNWPRKTLSGKSTTGKSGRSGRSGRSGVRGLSGIKKKKNYLTM